MQNKLSVGDIVTTSLIYRTTYISSGNAVPPDEVGIIMDIAEYNFVHTGETFRYGIAWFNWTPKLSTSDGLLWYHPDDITKWKKDF